MAQHFIEKLCEADVYKKLGLKAFFDQKLSQSDLTIAVDCENAHANLALTCLRVLNEEFSEEASGLLWYSGSSLTYHLEKIDLDNIDPRLKAEFGPRLVTLFTQSATANPEKVRIVMGTTLIADGCPCPGCYVFHVRPPLFLANARYARTFVNEWTQAL